MNTPNLSTPADKDQEIAALKIALEEKSEEIEKLRMKIHHWINVKDLLPIENQEVICLNLFGRIVQKSWMEYTDQDAEWFKKNFTHWQQLPELPINI